MIARFIIPALLAIAVTGPDDADARDHARHGKNARGKAKERLHAALELTDSQKEQLKILRAQHRTERQEQREPGAVSREEVRALRKQHREEFHQLLTDEQRQTILIKNIHARSNTGPEALNSLFRVHLFSRQIRQHIRDPRRLAVAHSIVGDDLFCPNDLYFFKPPGTG